jgi:hypothetical protein
MYFIAMEITGCWEKLMFAMGVSVSMKVCGCYGNN